MSEELEARQIENYSKTTTVVKLSDRGILRDVETGELCESQDCRDCNTCNELIHGVRDSVQTDCGVDYHQCISAGACGSPITSTARRLANLQHTDLRLRQSLHCSCMSKHVKNHKLQKPHLKINLKVKNITKQITMKYFKKIKCFISSKNTARKRWFETNRKNNQLVSLKENNPRRRKKYYVGKTAPIIGLSLANSVNVLKTSTILSSVSSSLFTIMAHSRKGHQTHGNNCTKLTTTKLFSRLMLYLKQFFGIIMKTQTTKKMNRKRNTANEQSTVVLNSIFPYRSDSSNTLYNINKIEWGTQSSVMNAVSDVSSALSSSIESFNDQGTQVSEHSAVQNLIVNIEPFVKTLYSGNAYSQCILRPNDVLLQYRNKNAKTNIKKSRRVTFRGHHKRFMTRTYGQNFNKMYHTFLAEVNYTNQPLQSGQYCEGVGIGSNWDINIDFGKSQDFPKQPGPDPNSGSLKNQRPHNGTLGKDSGSKNNVLQPYQCSPGVCVYGTCDKNVCYKRLKRTVPYGSHASTQSHKSKKFRDQRAVRENPYSRKKVNMTKSRNNKRGRENRLAGNQIASTPTGLPSRGAARIGSKSSFNFQIYKKTPVGARTAVHLNKHQTSKQINQGGTTARRKTDRTRKKERPLETLECEPGICVPDKCDPSDCYRQLKGTVTETSGSGSSQVSTQSPRLKRRQLRTERKTLYKEKGTSSKLKPKSQLKIPNRQAVRIGSNCSFNIEFYRSCPQNALAMSKQDRGDTTDRSKVDRIRKKKRPLETLECEPGICVPDKCDPSDCYRRQKGIVTKTSGSGSSQVSTQSPRLKGRQLRTGKETLYKEKGTSSKPRPKAQLQMPNRQAVRIGSKCSFNIEFYRSCPQNALTMSKQDGGDTTVRRKVDRTRKKKRLLQTLECEPGICVPDKCDPSDCYRRLKGTVTETSGSGSSQVSTQSPRLKGRQLRTGRETLYKEKGTLSKPRPKAQLQMPNRQAVRIGSKCSFNIEFYKSLPQNTLPMSEQDRGYSSDERKGARKQGTVLKKYQCEPGVCVPGRCYANKCFQELKIKQSTGTDASLTGSSKGTSQGSQTSTKARKKRQELTAGKSTFYKDKGASSMPRHKMPLQIGNRQVVRIGSKCSFNIEFYKSLPQNALPMSEKDRGYTSDGRKGAGKQGKVLKKYQCEPGVCAPGKCNANECFQQLKTKQSTDASLKGSSKGTSQGSQTSTKARKKIQELTAGKSTFYKDKGASSMPRPKIPLNIGNRQVVRIGSKCSFDIEFYKSMPQNAIPMSEKDRGYTSDGHKGTGKRGKVLKQYQCEPGVCVPGKCNANECFQKLKNKQSTGTDASVMGSSKGASQGSQTSTKARKKRQELREGKPTFYKDKGASSMPRPKMPLQIGNRQVVRIGSKCSFNIEFYKSFPQNALPMSEKDRGFTSGGRKGAGKQGKVLQKYQCEPGLCVPGKCNANECFQQLKIKQSTGTDTSLTGSSKGTSQGSQTSTKARNKRQELTAGKSTLYKDKGASSMPRPKMPLQIGNRQVVRIGSKCSFNIEFYKSFPQNALPMSKQYQGATSHGRKRTGKQGKILKKYQCEPGVCVPGKCNANECFQQLQIKQSTGKDASITGSSIGTSQGSQTSTKARKKRQELTAGKSTFYKDRGASSMPRPKMPLQTGNRQVVRIGSKCSFNIEFYKSFPQNALPMSKQYRGATPDGRKGTGKQGKILKKYQCEPGVCVPGKCNANECFQQLKIKHSTGTDTSLTGSTKGTSQGSQTSTKARKKGQELTAGKSTLYKDKGASSMPRPKMPLQIGNRQVVRIGSKCSFNIEFYKSLPQNALLTSEKDRGYTSGGRKGAGKHGTVLKKYQCQPGVCAPGKCNANECFQQLKIKQSTATDASLTGSSKGTSQRSQTSTKARKKRPTAAESTLYKDKGASSMPRPKMPLQIRNRQVVRIGSKCSFNIEFYKSWPQNGLAMSEQAGTGKQGQVIKKYQCEPGVCVPGKCNANECFQLLRTNYEASGFGSSLTGSTRGSQANTKRRKNKTQVLKSGKATIYKDKSVASKLNARKISQIPKHNRQVVRIGSDCSFNIEFYKSWPQNGLAMRSMGEQVGTGKTRKALGKFQCKPGVCVSSECNANQCYQRIKTENETSEFDSSLTGSSRGSRVTTKRRKNKTHMLKSGNMTLYKDTGAARKPLDATNRQAVRIGSMCSFNIEFHKGSRQDTLVTNTQSYLPTKSLPGKRKPRRTFECEPNSCIPGKCNPSECFKQFECKPRVCVPGKCDPSDCIQRLRGTPTGTDESLTGSSISTQSRKLKGGKPRECDKTVYKEKGVSCIPKKPKLDQQCVRIGSSCSFNIEFYKTISPPMMGEPNYPTVDINNQGDSGKKRKALKKYECPPGICMPGKCKAVECYNRLKASPTTVNDQSDSSGGKKSKRKRKTFKKYECEPGVCIPGKCNAKECFQLFKAKHNIDIDGSLTDSSLATSRASQASKKRKNKQPELRAGNATFYTERGASTMPRSKMLLHLQNRQAVRIGSTCSFNIEFYKGLPHKRLRDANARKIQYEQHPIQYNIDQNKQYPPQFYPSSSETSGDSTSTSLPQVPQSAGLRTGIGKKGKISRTKDKMFGMKDKISGMKEKLSGMKEKISGKKEKISGENEIISGKKEKISEKKPRISGKKEHMSGKKEKISEKKEKISEKKEKDKSKQKKQPAGKYDQGDTTVQQKISSGTEGKNRKRKTTQEKPSARQTEQGDTTTKQKMTTEKKNKPSKEIRTKRKQSQTRVRDQQSDTQVNEKVGTGKLHDQGDTAVQRNAEIKKIGRSLKEKQKGTKRAEGEYDQGDKGFEYEKKEHVGTSAVASPQSSDSVSVSKTTSVNLERKEEAERRKTKASTLPIYKNIGTSHIATDKKGEGIQQLQRIPPLGTSDRKKQRVFRIGSSCSFNFQIYKDKPLTPAQAASLRSESTPVTPVLPEVDTERKSMASKITKCLCRFIGQRGAPCPSAITGRGSQTNQRFEYVPGFCDYAKCEKNQCPARFNNTDTGIGTDTYGKSKPAMLSCCTNAATQSRRCPALQHLSLRGPSRAATRLRNVPYPSIVPGNWPFGSVPGYGDNFNRYLIREQAVILGSGCGFNVKFFKKRK